MRKSFLTLIILTLSVLSYSQTNVSSWRKFESNPNLIKTVGPEYNTFVKQNYSDSIPQSDLSEYKAYLRWMNFWSKRLGEDNTGNLSYEPYFEAAKNLAINPYCDGSDLADWELIGPVTSDEQNQGLITEVLYDPVNPDVPLISSNHGGLWKFNTNNNEWYNVTDDLNMPGIAATEIVRSPFNSNVLFASTGSGIFKSEYGMGIIKSINNGEDWTVLSSFLANGVPYVVKILIDPNDSDPNDVNLYVISKQKLYFSSDSGDNWSTIVELSNLPNIINGSIFYDLEIDNNNGIYLTTEGLYGYNGQCFKYNGSTWNEIITNNSTVNPQRIKFTKPHNGLIFALVDVSDARKLFKTTNYGANWSVYKESVSVRDPKCEIEYSPNSDYIYIGDLGMNVVDHSTGDVIDLPYNDSENNSHHFDIRDIVITGELGDYENILFANDGGLSRMQINKYSLEDYSFTNLNGDHLPVNNFVGLGVGQSNNDFILAGATHGHILAKTNNYMTFFYGGDGDDAAINPHNVTDYYYSSNGGVTSSINGRFYNGAKWFIGMPMEIHPVDYKLFYFGLDGELGFYNRLTGNLELKASPINGNGNNIKIGGIEITNDEVLYVSDFENITNNSVQNADNTARISRSFNNGTTWEDLSFNYVTYTENGNTEYKQLKHAITWKPITDIESDPSNPDQIWISVGGVYKSSVQIIDETLRVIKSNDGGDTWIDFSEGLPAFPVNTILYDSVSETLFAGTDAGVFYRHPYDNTMTEWECFSDGMPIAIVTDLEINNCTRTLFASTDSRGLFKTPIPFTEVNGSSIVWEDDHLVTTEEVWDTDRYFDGEIMVSTGGILRINSRVELTENSRIVVLPGGQLFLSDTLIGSCNDFWKGIQLRGNANMPQTNQYQGALRTLPGATIINAEIGVANYGYNSNGVMIENSQGGIAIISDATFVNNKIAVEFNSYQNPSNYSDASVITKSKFLTSANYYSHDYPETPIGVQIINNNQISISKNEFTGLDHLFLIELPDYSLFPKAINCWNSSCIISNNEFTHLDNAVYAMNYFPNEKLVKLDQNLFYECYKSVYLNGISNAFISRNWFGTDHYGGWNFHNYKKVQIYLDQCPNFIIEENDIDYYGIVEDSYNIGVVINNCGPNNNKIYRNKFFSNYDILVQGSNRDATGDNGLEIKCNDFHSLGDIGVSDFNVTNQSGIAASQGSNEQEAYAPAGNLFTNYSSSLEYHFLNLDEIDNVVTYWHHNPNTNTPRLRPGHNHDELINNVDREENDQPWDYESSCPSNLTGWGGDIKDRMLIAGNNTTNLENTLQALTDGGNTPELSEEVNEATETEAFTLRNELLNIAPYTSDQVLVEATEKEDVLTNPLIRDVLIANPQAAKDKTVLGLIENRQNPMPDYMKQQIINGQTYTGAKEQLEALIHQNKVEYTNALTHLSAFYFSDTTIVNPIDSILPYLMEAKNIESHYQLAGIYLQENNITAMNNTLNAIANNFSLDSYRQTELQDLTSYYSLLANLKSENRNLFQLTEAEKQQLFDWENDNANMVATYARNILIHIGEIEYEVPIILPDMGNKSTLLKTPYEIEIPNEESSILNVYPNPSKDYCICEYDIKHEYNKAYILIMEAASGKADKKIRIEYQKDSKTIDLRDVKSGSYLITLQIDGNLLDQKKLEIVK